MRSSPAVKAGSNRFVATIIILGCILIASGMLLFIASNWEHPDKPYKLTLIFCCIIGFNCFGAKFLYGKNSNIALGHSFLLIGSVRCLRSK
ncbi:MAG: DUF2157 domain-containing protein [Candidatus Omnitrophota bacterium]